MGQMAGVIGTKRASFVVALAKCCKCSQEIEFGIELSPFLCGTELGIYPTFEDVPPNLAYIVLYCTVCVGCLPAPRCPRRP